MPQYHRLDTTMAAWVWQGRELLLLLLLSGRAPVSSSLRPVLLHCEPDLTVPTNSRCCRCGYLVFTTDRRITRNGPDSTPNTPIVAYRSLYASGQWWQGSLSPPQNWVQG